MAYQNVGTPRFYVDHGLWLHSSGVKDFYEIDTWTGLSYEMLLLNPSVTRGIGIPSADYGHVIIGRYAPVNYIALLGHQMGGGNCFPQWRDGINSDLPSNMVSVVNGGNNTGVEYDGFSITVFDDNPSATQFGIVIDGAGSGSYLNAASIGSYYDMPHSPDLSLTLTREYGGVKTIETKGGSTLSNDFGSKPPAWGDLGAWELGSADPKLSRSGRRIWDLSFSYLSAKDIMGAPELVDQSPATAELGGGDTGGTNLVGLGWDSDDVDDNDSFAYNLMNHNDFYSQVIHKTNGGQLPFIFQPDSSNNSPDAFAIAKLDMKEFKFKQVANGVYNVKLKIREVW